ncbi:MAG: hypothetical protein WBA57_25785 [Elainellaceae cyanobacterium]
MTQKIRSQATQFWTVLASSETLDTYQKAADLTWQIIKEGALLIWLVLCLVLVGLDLGAEKAIATGRSTRTWLNSIQENDSNQLATDTKQKLITAGKTRMTTAIAQARQQIGLPEKNSTDLAVASEHSMKSAAPLDGTPQSAPPASEPSSASEPNPLASAPATSPQSEVATPTDPSPTAPSPMENDV